VSACPCMCVCGCVWVHTRRFMVCITSRSSGPVYVSLLHISRWYVCQFLVSSLFLLHQVLYVCRICRADGCICIICRHDIVALICVAVASRPRFFSKWSVRSSSHVGLVVCLAARRLCILLWLRCALRCASSPPRPRKRAVATDPPCRGRRPPVPALLHDRRRRWHPPLPLRYASVRRTSGKGVGGCWLGTAAPQNHSNPLRRTEGSAQS